MSDNAQGRVERELVCIACPMACRMVVSVGPAAGAAAADTAGGPAGADTAAPQITVTGNRCPRGEAYGREEMLSPKRILTAVVPTDCAEFPFAPVRTDRSIRREKSGELLEMLYGRKVRLPVREGQVLIEEFDGARVLITRTLPPDEVPAVREARAKAEGEDQVPGLQQSP